MTPKSLTTHSFILTSFLIMTTIVPANIFAEDMAEWINRKTGGYPSENEASGDSKNTKAIRDSKWTLDAGEKDRKTTADPSARVGQGLGMSDSSGRVEGSQWTLGAGHDQRKTTANPAALVDKGLGMSDAVGQVQGVQWTLGAGHDQRKTTANPAALVDKGLGMSDAVGQVKDAQWTLDAGQKDRQTTANPQDLTSNARTLSDQELVDEKLGIVAPVTSKPKPGWINEKDIVNDNLVQAGLKADPDAPATPKQSAINAAGIVDHAMQQSANVGSTMTSVGTSSPAGTLQSTLGSINFNPQADATKGLFSK